MLTSKEFEMIDSIRQLVANHNRKLSRYKRKHADCEFNDMPKSTVESMNINVTEESKLGLEKITIISDHVKISNILLNGLMFT